MDVQNEKDGESFEYESINSFCKLERSQIDTYSCPVILLPILRGINMIAIGELLIDRGYFAGTKVGCK